MQLFRNILIGLSIFVVVMTMSEDAFANTENSDPAKLDPLVLQLKWRHQFQFAGYYAAIAQGFFQDEGLDVTLRELMEGEDPAELVAQGIAHYGIGTSELLVSHARGLPVVVLAAIYQHSPYAIATLQRPDIESIHDLANKRIMVESQAAEVWAYMRNEGLDTDNLNVVKHSFDIHQLIKGEVDAMTVYTTDEPYSLTMSGHLFNLFNARSGGIDFYGDVLFTSQTEVHERPERVAAFRRASKLGWQYALKHPQEIAELIYNHYSKRKDINQLLYEARHSQALIRLDLVEWGYMNPGRWRHIGETYEELGLIPKGWSLDTFIYEPEPEMDWQAYYQMIGLFCAALLVVGLIASRFYILNKKLRIEITKRRQTQKKLQKALDLERNLLEVLAHDFRNPITVIDASVQLLALALPKRETLAHRELGKIKAAGHMLDNLITSCMTREQLEGMAPLEFIPMNLSKTVINLVNDRQALNPQQKMQLQTPDTDIIINGNSMLIGIAVGNLLVNAQKYSPIDGEIRIKLHTEKNIITLSVNDDGAGLEETELERVFEKFYRSPRAAKGKGSGLGLFAAREIIHVHKGSIKALSGPGGKFIITLPQLDESPQNIGDLA
ncbi:MAG: ABC transporter substrate-binding protein [Magnetococcales bacterium]|nr:ABC transporter substrate-binding protein [Magnetococcales bacterium]